MVGDGRKGSEVWVPQSSDQPQQQVDFLELQALWHRHKAVESKALRNYMLTLSGSGFAHKR